MGWESLGTLSPGVEWHSYPSAVVNSETLRIIQTFDSDTVYAHPALLGQYFSSLDGIGKIHKIWAIDRQPRIIELPFPKDFRDSGELVYIPMLKAGHRAFNYTSWSIEVQVYY